MRVLGLVVNYKKHQLPTDVGLPEMRPIKSCAKTVCLLVLTLFLLYLATIMKGFVILEINVIV